MALITADRIKETTVTTGTGAVALDGASAGYRAFSAVMTNGDTCYYCIANQAGTEWEVGLGTYNTGNTFSRTTIHASSNSGSAVSFSAGIKDVFLTLTATQFNANSFPVNMASQVTGVLPVANGGTGTATGSITGTGALTISAGGTNQSVTVSPSGTGTVLINKTEFGTSSYPYGSYSFLRTVQRTDSGDGGLLAIVGPSAKTSGKGGAVSISPGVAAGGGARGYVSIDGVIISDNAVGASLISVGSTGIKSQNSIAIGWGAGNTSNESTYGGNVYLGQDAGRYYTTFGNEQTSVYKSICLGYRSYTANNNDSYSIVIGAEAVGDGANTTVIGKSDQVSARLNGYTKTKSVQETVFTITDGASVDINPANGGVQVWVLGANRTPTATSFGEGQSVTLMIDDGTAYSITWSTIGVTWVGGSAPTLATTGYTVVELWKRGTTVYGALVGNA